MRGFLWTHAFEILARTTANNIDASSACLAYPAQPLTIAETRTHRHKHRQAPTHTNTPGDDEANTPLNRREDYYVGAGPKHIYTWQADADHTARPPDTGKCLHMQDRQAHIYICVRAYVHTLTHTHTCVHRHVRTYAEQMHVGSYVHIRTQAHTIHDMMRRKEKQTYRGLAACCMRQMHGHVFPGRNSPEHTALRYGPRPLPTTLMHAQLV